MLKGLNRLAMLIFVTLGMATGSLAVGGAKLRFESVVDAHYRYKNLSVSGKKVVGEHMMIWNTISNTLRYKDEDGLLSYYVDPDSSLTGGTYTELQVFSKGRVQRKKIILPKSETQAKQIIADKESVERGFTRIFDGPLGKIRVHEAYDVRDNKLGSFRMQNGYFREQNEYWINARTDDLLRGFYISTGRKNQFVTDKFGNFILPDTIPGQIQ
ncbi:MAG: hypothetical protein ACXWRU_18725 [Pseudobdellovibrionaceae bacterium]